jgi:anti-sigma regulatory factor (Ser/Thr protein kinase)
MFYSETLPKSATSPALARQLLDRLSDEVSEPVLENARLLVSELVTNAVEHVRDDGEIEVRVGVAGDMLRIEVLDPGPGFTPAPRAPGQSKASGWGLHFTDRVAERWAVDRDDRSRVWFELRKS